MDIEDLLASANPQFEPHMTYSSIGDFVEVWLDNEHAVTEQVNPYVAIHWDETRTRVLGFQVAGVGKLLLSEDRLKTLEGKP